MKRQGKITVRELREFMSNLEDDMDVFVDEINGAICVVTKEHEVSFEVEVISAPRIYS